MTKLETLKKLNSTVTDEQRASITSVLGGSAPSLWSLLESDSDEGLEEKLESFTEMLSSVGIQKLLRLNGLMTQDQLGLLADLS